MGSFELREWREGDVASLQECARASFEPQGQKSLESWRWAFERPGFDRRGIVALDGERVVAAYLGIAQRLWIGGEERECVQPVDLMVHPEQRQGLQRRGLYLQVAEAFIERYGVQGTDAFHYGWPIAAARRSGQRHLRYEFLREELALTCELSGTPVLPSEVSTQIEFGEDQRWLWDRCASEWGAATIRDQDWLRWRFVDCPDRQYQLLGVHDGDVLRGYAVLLRSAWTWPGVVPVCDWMVPAAEREVSDLLETGVRALAAAWGAQSLVGVFPDRSKEMSYFQDRGWSVRPTTYQCMVRSYDRRFDVDWLRDHWWYSLADSDLV